MINTLSQEIEKNSKHLLPRTTSETKKRFVKLISVSGIAMSLMLPIGMIPRIMQSYELDQVHAKIENQLPSVSVTKVQLAPPIQKFSLPGNVEALVETPIYARSNGYIEKLLVDIGDRVNTGQVLARMQTPEVEQNEKEAKAQLLTTIATKDQSEANRDRAQADLDNAIAQLSVAKATLIERQSTEVFAKSTMHRWKALGLEGAVAIQDVDEKETNYKTSQAATQAAEEFVNASKSAVIAARSRLKAEEANVKLSAANISAATAHADFSSTERSFQNVLSPFSGVITERNIDTGTLISSGSENSKLPLYRLARIDTVKVFVDVPQYASRGIHIGQDVSITLKEFPDRVFTGKVARTSVAMDSTARTLRTEIHVPNADLALVPGMYVDANFSIASPIATFLIPANSLILRAEGPQAIALTADKKVHYRKIQLGNDLGKQVEVLAGLNNKDTVIINPSDTLREGALVTVIQ